MRQYITILLIVFSTFFYAQEITVYDAGTGKPINEVSVFNKNKFLGEITNDNGKVDITDFKSNEIIHFSHVSYANFSIKKRLIIENNHNEVYLSKESEQLDEIVVSVFRKEAKTNRIAKQIAVISKNDIQKKSPQTTADLLTNIAGVKVQKSQFGGGSPILRGMESNRVLLVVDGVRMNNAIYRKGHLQNSITVNPYLLDKTEIVFGPSSVSYGSDALGGVIHYYTKTPKLSKQKEIKSSFLSRFSTVNNEISNVASAELRFKKWASFTSISHSNFGDVKMGKNRTHGFNNWGKVSYYSENTEDYFTENPTKNTDENTQKNTGYAQTDVLQKIYLPLSKNTDFTLNIQYSTSSNIPRFDRLSELKSQNDFSSLKFAEWYYGPQKRLLISPQLKINPKKKWIEKGVFTLAFQDVRESRIQRRFGSLNRSYRKENVKVYSINGDFTVPIAQQRNLGYGFELTYNDVFSNAYGKKLRVSDEKTLSFSENFIVQTRYPDGGSSYLSSALYVDYRQDISRNSTLNTGVRLTHTHLTAKWNDETFIKLPDNDITLNNTAVTATMGYVYKPNKTWQLNAVLSSGFRSPNLDDVGKVREKNGKVTVPNINLKPEHAYNVEIGFQKYFNDRKFRIGANAYYTLLNNYIYRDDFQLNKSSTILYDNEEKTMVANVNKGNAYIQGATISYQGKLSNRLKTNGFITYTKGKTYDTNEPLSSIPPLFGNFEVNYAYLKIETGANLRFNARKKITDYNLTEGIDNHTYTPIINNNAEKDIDKYYGTPSWVTFGLFGKYIASKNLTFQGKIENLFDTHYKEFASGVSASGRNFSIGLLVWF